MATAAEERATCCSVADCWTTLKSALQEHGHGLLRSRRGFEEADQVKGAYEVLLEELERCAIELSLDTPVYRARRGSYAARRRRDRGAVSPHATRARV